MPSKSHKNKTSSKTKSTKKKSTHKKKIVKMRTVNTTRRIPIPNQVATVTRNKGPNVGKGTTLTNHQNITSVYSSADEYTVASFVIQPGDSKIFPWLSKMAVNYETYRFTSLTATYNPLVGTGVSGRVAMYWEYDIFDPPPTDYITATAQPGFVSTSPFFAVSSKLDIKKAYRLTPIKYVKSTSTLDRLNDTAKLVVIILSPTGETPMLLGQISLAYTISLQTPSADGPANYNTGSILFESLTSQLPGEGGSVYAPLPSVLATHNTISPSITSTTPNGFVKLPQGQYNLRADYSLASGKFDDTKNTSASLSHGFQYSNADNLSTGTFEKCSDTANGVPVTNMPNMTSKASFECFVDLAVETYVAPVFGFTNYENLGTASIVEGATLAIERIANSVSAALFGGGGFLQATPLETPFAPLPTPEQPTWPIPAPPSSAPTPPSTSPPPKSETKQLGEMVLTAKAKERLALRGYSEPFPELVLDALPPEEWVVVRGKA
jgi:hypothetical protein